MITLRPYDDLAAFAVLKALDPHDQMEVEVTRGAAATHLALFADWRQMQGLAVASFVAHAGAFEVPFAVLMLTSTGQAGVASAALLARDHRQWRRPLAALALRVRREMPEFCARAGITRIEARAWAGHPRASTLLAAIGFHLEAEMPGFGRAGCHVFRQFAWTAPALPRTPE